MQKITPFLWFDNGCEEAVNFYVSIFPNSKILNMKKYPEGMQEEHMKGMEGKILTAEFELNGFRFMGLDGGPYFKKNPSISFFVNFDPSRDANAESNLNELWLKLSEGGKALMPLQEYPFSKRYGWIEDKYGVSWQLILTNPEGEPRPYIVPSFLFTQHRAGQAEEALNFYVSTFKNSKLGTIARYPAGMEPDKEGTVMFGEARLEEQWFAAMDSAHKHEFIFNEGVSLLVECGDQAEIDYYWEKLSAVPESEQCGWLKDKYGVSWQITPKMSEMFSADKEKEKRGMAAMLKMKKIDIETLRNA